MDSQLSLIAAIRSGNLNEVRAALDSGHAVELNDGRGDPGLPMGIACFMGFVEIVRELVKRGAAVNLVDNSLPTSPLSMAVRGRRTEVVRALIELGAEVPPTLNTGLGEQEVILAQWVAQRDGKRPPLAGQASDHPVVEEIQVLRCVGIDTQVLEADALRAMEGVR